MNIRIPHLHGALALLLGCQLAGVANAAQPDPAALEPAVQTSPAPRSAAPAPAPAATPARPPGETQRPAAPARATPQPAAASGGRARDRVDLEATQITGNRELPRVMYVVPWKKSDLGELGGRPANSLLDEVLTPVDRDVFQRQNRYYDALKPDAKASGAAAPAGNEGSGATAPAN
jgi:hypothetical protein